MSQKVNSPSNFFFLQKLSLFIGRKKIRQIFQNKQLLMGIQKPLLSCSREYKTFIVQLNGKQSCREVAQMDKSVFFRPFIECDDKMANFIGRKEREWERNFDFWRKKDLEKKNLFFILIPEQHVIETCYRDKQRVPNLLSLMKRYLKALTRVEQYTSNYFILQFF